MGRLRGFLWLVAGLAVAGLAGLVAFITLSRASAQTAGDEVARPKVAVVVAARAIALRTVLTAEDLEVKEWPVDTVPEGAISGVREAEGKLALADLYPGEVVVAQRLLDPNVVSENGRIALFMVEDEVLMAFPAQDLMSRVGLLKPGDRVDLLISLQFPVDRGLQVVSGGRVVGASAGTSQDEELATFCVLQNVGVAGIIGGQTDPGKSTGPFGGASSSSEGRSLRAILFTLSPQDALVLKHVMDAGGTPDIVLRAPDSESPFSLEPVDVDYVINRYQIPTRAGQ